jgi:glycosyltransferase involved in cell wall biosynthesis
MKRGNYPVHIINPFAELGGSEWRALSLYEMLRPHADVFLWTEYEPDAYLAAHYPIRRIRYGRAQFPKTGTFVFVGVYFRVGRWYYLTRPHRVILVNNIPVSHSFWQRVRKLSLRGLRRIEVVYPSKMLQASYDFPGVVEVSPIDIARFSPGTAVARADGRFVVGRLSRDVAEKHHADDPALYRKLVEQGFRVRILGGTCLQPVLGGEEFIDLLPVGSEDPALFLQGLDALFYRTSAEWLEPFGRVVVEAMACSVPVVCHNRGGYVEVVENGRNGFLFETDAEALDILLRLKGDPELCLRIGMGGRTAVEEMFSPERQAEMAAFYLA